MAGGGRGKHYFNHKDGAPLMFAGIWQEPSTRATSALRSRSGSRCGLTPNESRVAENLLLDLKEFTVRPMDRAMNNVQAEGLGRDRPIRGQPGPMPGTAGWEDTVHWLDCAWFARWKSFHTTTVFARALVSSDTSRTTTLSWSPDPRKACRSGYHVLLMSCCAKTFLGSSRRGPQSASFEKK
jgi:hypothetical protein